MVDFTSLLRNLLESTRIFHSGHGKSLDEVCVSDDGRLTDYL